MPPTQPTADDGRQVATPNAATQAANTRPDRRTLPGWAIDLIRDGVDPRDLTETGHRAVYKALGSTALAAVNAGWTRPEWEDEVESPRSKLGLQNRLRDQDKVRSKRSSTQSLNTAWERAEKYAAVHPAWTREEARDEARRRAHALRLVAADADVILTDNERVLLAHVADQAAALGCSAVNVPRLATARATGLGEKFVRLALERLVDRGLLDQTERGRARTKTKPGRANTYRIPDDAQLRRAATSPSRVPRQVGPDSEVGRPQAVPLSGPTIQAGAHLAKARPIGGSASSQRRSRSDDLVLRAQRGIENFVKRSWADAVENAHANS